MPKKLLKKEIEVILKEYSKSKNIEELANQFNCTKLTIKRHLKKNSEKENLWCKD